MGSGTVLTSTGSSGMMGGGHEAVHASSCGLDHV